MSHIRIVALAVLLVFVPACAKRAEPTPPAPAVGLPDLTDLTVVYEGTAPPPREVIRATPDDAIPPPRPAVGERADGSLAFEGRKLFLKLQCINCHSAKPDARGPVLEGLYGTKVALAGGGAETVDDAYIVESIRKPKAKVVEGWEPVMPAYDETKVTVEEVNALVAFIRSLKRGGLDAKEERFPAPVGAPAEPKKEPPPK